MTPNVLGYIIAAQRCCIAALALVIVACAPPAPTPVPPTNVPPTQAPTITALPTQRATSTATIIPTLAPTATRVPPTLVPAPFPISTYSEPPPMPPFTPAKIGSSDKNVTYCIVGGVELKLDIYYPRLPATQKYLLIVYIHGGELKNGDKGLVGPDSPINGPAFTAHGYAFASLNYRLGPEYRLPTMIEDVKCAIRHLRARAATYNIDPDRIGVTGTSSGGYLVAMLGLADASAGFEGRGAYAGVSSRVQAVIPEYPQVSFESPSFSNAETESREAALPPNASQELKHLFTLTTFVSSDDPPFLFFHGSADPALNPALSQDLSAKLVAAGVTSSHVLVVNGGHGWKDRSPRKAGVPYGPAPGPDEITNQELAFFDKYLKK